MGSSSELTPSNSEYDTTMSRVEEIGEFNLIRRLTSISSSGTSPPVMTGVGDDAAVYRPKPGMAQVVTTDALIEGYHFDFDFYRMDHIGYKAMVVNLSDIAAMNAQPILATVALGIPRSFSTDDLESLYRGLTDAASKYGVQIVGGDTTRSPVLLLSITIIGEAPVPSLVYRNGASPGDSICVSGNLGDAAAGLDLLRNHTESHTLEPNVWDALTTRHLMPTPRLDLVLEWAQKEVRPSALIDISDGLANEVHHICAASRCGAILWESKLPLSPELRAGAPKSRTPVDYALNGGDDYELLFTAPSEILEQMPSGSFTPIGVVTTKDVLIHREDGTLESLKPEGHDHFRAI